MQTSQNSFTQTRWFVLLLGALTAMDPLSIDMYLPAFSDIQKSFETSFSLVEMSVSAFFVGMAFGQLIYGPLADRFGRKKPLMAGMMLYLIATIGCAYAPNIETFIFARVLQALGGCAGMVITRAIVRDVFDKKRVAEFLSSMALVMGLAPILAPSMGSFVNHYFGWKAIFVALALANIFCFICIYMFLPETNFHRKEKMDLIGTLKAYGGLLKTKSFVGYLIPDAAVRAGMFAYIAGSPFVFIELFGIPKEQYGWIFGMNGLGLMAASQINRRLLKRYDPELILKWSVRAAFVAALIVFIAPQVSMVPAVTLLPLFLFLACLNFIGPNSLAGALATQGHQAGTASALYGCLQWSLASGSAFLVSHFHNGTAMPMTGVILGCGLFSLVAFTILVNPKKRIPQNVKPVPNEAEPGS
jgi:drug resistance transporter, Bcr/CflA subfamily